MPTPTFVGMGTLDWTSLLGSVSPGLPSGWAVGDVHFLMVRRTWGSSNPNPPTSGQAGPAGWALEADIGETVTFSGLTRGRMQVWSRRAESGDGAPSVTIGDETTLTCRVYGWRDCVWWSHEWDDVVVATQPYPVPSLVIPANRAGFLLVLSAGGVLSASAAPPFTGGPRTVYNGWTPTPENPPFFISSVGAGNGTTFRRADSPGTFPGPSLVSQTEASFAVAAFTLSAVPRPPTAAVFVGGATRVAVAPT